MQPQRWSGKQPNRPRQFCRPCLEQLEDRLAPAIYTWDNSASTLHVNLGTDESVIVSQSGADMAFTLSAGTFTQSGGATASGSGTGAITIASADLAVSVTIDNTGVGAGTNNVSFSGAGSLSSGAVGVSITDPDASGAIAFSGGFDIAASSAIALTTVRNIMVGNGTVLSSSGSGGITLSANLQATPTSGSFVGMDLIAATIRTTGSGNISLGGRGGDTGNNNYGIRLRAAATVESTGTAAGAGLITIDGTGGAGASLNVGVEIAQATRVASVVGAILITGQGGAGSGNNNTGVVLFNAVVASTGTGPAAATITLNGTGGSGTSQNSGLKISSGTQVTSVRGDIAITGQGGDGSASNNDGVALSAVVSSTGTGADAATITITGTGGSGSSAHSGVVMESPGMVTAIAGDIAITGQGGVGSGSANYGVFLRSSLVSSTGTGADAATITIHGTGGAGSTGVQLEGLGMHVTSFAGDIQVNGWGDDLFFSACGVILQSSAVVSSTGPATITIDGTGGQGSSGNQGVVIQGTGTQVTSVVGNIAIIGQGRGDGSDVDNFGVLLRTSALISSTGTGADAATITIAGTGGAGTSGLHGVAIEGAGTVTSVAGDIQITGQGGLGSSNSNRGVSLSAGAVVSSTGIGAAAATITINGTGGAGTDDNGGVVIHNPGTQVTAVGGELRIVGQGGGGAGANNVGVWLLQAGVISSMGTGADAARITIIGTGGGTGISTGVRIDDTGSVGSVDGAIQITGTPSSANGTAIDLLTDDGIAVSGTATVTLSADSMDIAAANAIAAGGSRVTLRPKTAGTAIDVGGVDAAGVLGLPDDELDRIDAGTLIMGDSGSGTLAVGAIITRTARTDVELHSGAAILFDPGSLDTAGGDLLLAPGVGGVQPLSSGIEITAGTVSFAAPLSIAIDGLAVDSQYTQLHVAGTVDLSGAELVLSGSYVPAGGDVFTIVAASSVTGLLNGLDAGAAVIFNGVPLRITYTATAVTLSEFITTTVIASGTQAHVFNADGSPRFDLVPYGPRFTAGVRVAVGDLSGDGVPDVITASGSGRPTEVRVFDGRTGAPLSSFQPYGPRFRDGAFVAVGDVHDNPGLEIVVGPNGGRRPVIVFDLTGNKLAGFFPYGRKFKQGVRLAAGNADGNPGHEIITAKGGGNGQVRVFDGAGRESRRFRPFQSTGGVSVAAGDVDGDGQVEIIAARDAGYHCLVRIFDAATRVQERQFNAYPGFKGGVRLGVLPRDDASRRDILTAGGRGNPGVKLFDGLTTAHLDSIFADFAGGSFVAGG